MPDHEVMEGDVTLEELARAIGQMKEEAAQREAGLRSEIARLEARLPLVEARGRSGDRPAVPSTAIEPTHEQPPDAQPVSRRGAFKVLGAAAAGGVGVALGSAVLSAEPAAALTGTMMYGADNDAGADTTALNAATLDGHATFSALNATSNSFGLYGVVVAESGIGATEGSAVVGDTNGNGPGVEGLSGTGGIGVHGVAGSLTGVFLGSAGVTGESADFNSNGVIGLSTHSIGVIGVTYDVESIGVLGQNRSVDIGGPAVVGQSLAGIGGSFAGGLAPLSLAPGMGHGPPTGTGHFFGEFYVDGNGAIFYCYAGDGTTSGEWVALTNGTFPVPPVRVIDTADGTGGITGPLVPGSTVHTSSAIAGTHGIPAAAVGVVGNLAISGVNGALLNGVGFATLFPAGEPTPATANINAGAGCFAISNAVTVGLGSGGSNAGKLSLVWSGGGPVPNAEAYFDVTGYIL